MPKSSTPRSSRVKPLADSTAFQVDLAQVDIHQVVRLGLEQFIYQAGLLLVRQVIEAEATQLAGQRYARSSEKTAHRYGSQPGSVYLAGQKVAVEKPRVVAPTTPRVLTKPTDGQPAQEMPLESSQAFAQPDAMNAAILERLLAGVSCRDYARTVETVIQGRWGNDPGTSFPAQRQKLERREAGRALDSDGVAGGRATHPAGAGLQEPESFAGAFAAATFWSATGRMIG